MPTNPEANQVITVQVSAGTTPTYTWDGAAARDVQVVRVNGEFGVTTFIP